MAYMHTNSFHCVSVLAANEKYIDSEIRLCKERQEFRCGTQLSTYQEMMDNLWRDSGSKHK